jgi:hypothetical protein
VEIPTVSHHTKCMIDFIILALAINPVWLPMFVNFVLDGLSMMFKSDMEQSEMRSRYSKNQFSKREQLIGWVVVPIGWLAAVYLLTVRIGAYTILDVTK